MNRSFGSVAAIPSAPPSSSCIDRVSQMALLPSTTAPGTSASALVMLEQHAGKVPVELTGRVPFPPIGELPYFVTLAPHGFSWFSLQDGGQEEIP